MPAQNPDVLIAGAGPTGLMLALWLTKLDVRVRIVDPKSGPTTETRAIAVQARTLEFYDQLGLGDEAKRRGTHFGKVDLWVKGRFVSGIQLSGTGADMTPHPYLYILTQDQNEQMLVACLQDLGVQIGWNTELTGFVQDSSGVTATLRQGADSKTVRTTYLAGCDGARSAVRHGLDVKLPGSTYGNRFYVADVTASGKIYQQDVNLSLDNQHFLAFFPMPEAGRHRIIGEVPESAGETPDFEVVRPQVEAHGLAHIDKVHWFSSYRVHHRVADRFRVGRAFVLGDAGHVHSPVGGQGMNTGLGDAANLAWKLAQVVHGGDMALLDTYESERRPFAVSLVNTTDRIFSGIVKSTAWARFLRTRAVPVLLPLVMRPRAVRRQFFLRVSQTQIHYPNSPLSFGRTSRVASGDRLPYVKTAHGSNFDSLTSLAWQVHVYGAVHPEVERWCADLDLPLYIFSYDQKTRKAGFTKDALYLVRPDGYIGLASPVFAKKDFDAYADHWLKLNADAPKLAKAV